MSAIYGETLTFTQENGPAIELTVFGDEFYARYETSTGYTVLYDAMLGLYCYAELADGEFVSTGIPAGEPPPDGIQPHLREAPEVSEAKFKRRFDATRPPADSVWANPKLETFGPNKGLLAGRQVNKGKVRGLTILVNFQDVQSTVSKAEVEAMLNADGYSAHGNYCSVREYFLRMSSGKLDYSNVVVGPITLSQNRQYYVNNLLAEEALNIVADMGLDLAQFDSRKQKYLDAVSFMYAGPVVYADNLWPHNYTLQWQHGKYRTNMYMITALGSNSSDLRIGTFCHESGHMLCRFPDLYDYGNRDKDFGQSWGLGLYCLMSAGNKLDYGRTPAPICAYLRHLAGWCPKKVPLNKPGARIAQHGAYDTVLLYKTKYANEYFLVENRSGLGLDAHLPSNGLAIYHCDIKGSNEWQAGEEPRHYQCALLQADGRLDLERGHNGGDAADMFGIVAGNALSDVTNPSTRLWDGSASGLRIADITGPGETISFRVL